MEQLVTVCDRCHRAADGCSPDTILFLSCGHDICSECNSTAKHRDKGECPICCLSAVKVGRTARVPSEIKDEEMYEDWL